MLLKEIKNIFHKELDSKFPKEEVDSFFYLCIEHYLGLERFILAVDPKFTITKEQEQPLFEALTQLKQERPIQYILGKTTFMDMDLMVNDQVLIPRPETEELVRWILDDYSSIQKPLQILDVGSGSGCIAIALAKYFPRSHVFALDLSMDALDITLHNAQMHNVAISPIHADILTTDKLQNCFDIMVSNPPYVREAEIEVMDNNVTKYEPSTALYVKDDNPLLFYKHIIKLAKSHLAPKGRLYFEINEYLGTEMLQLMEENNFLEIELRKDMFGKDRLVRGQRP